MADPEKSVPPAVVISQYDSPTQPSSSNKEFYSSLDQSPTSSVTRSEGDHDERALTLTTTQHSRRSQSLSRNVSRITTHGTGFTCDPRYEVDFGVEDPYDPRNWSLAYKAYGLFSISFGTLGVVMYSTSYTSGMGKMQAEFGVNSEAIATLGVTTYLFGLAIGCLLLAPIAETYGRKPVYMLCMTMFTILVLPAALAKSLQGIIITRFFGALFGSAMIANAPGTIADMVSDEYRSTAFSIWSIGPMNGPVIGPVIGGFVTDYLGWRWTNWIVMIWAGIASVLLIVMKETYSPVLLQKKAKKLRREENDDKYWSRYDIRVGFLELMKINLSRPFIMMIKEPICIFWNVYISLIYGILYLCFVAYPIIFTEERGWSTSLSGLSFLGIGIGTMICICCASPIRKMINNHKPDAHGNVPPEAMLSIVCLAAIMVPVGQIWFAWTCYPTSIHWSIPIAAGIPFGFGNGTVFIYSGNYLAYSYGIYAASAMAGNALMRSFLGGTLPLAGPSLYRALGPNWAGMFLGLLEVLIIPIPFLFYKYGGRIRQKSTMIREMRENEERQERRKKKAEERLRRAEENGDERERGEARVELCRVESRLDEGGNVEAAGLETLNNLQGLDRETLEDYQGLRARDKSSARQAKVEEV
ncbi:MFS transporter [Exophiala viscosa]|uniref:MFS transporter n=1 Tax=Exophiala viscosa TaxID=2486360 RepID=A0AAN6DNM4_9EURO|nr:MFS transporter [Exophiala viscosa]KAI1620636.1 MFS transporter [Exophiala viscosa]